MEWRGRRRPGWVILRDSLARAPGSLCESQLWTNGPRVPFVVRILFALITDTLSVYAPGTSRQFCRFKQLKLLFPSALSLLATFSLQTQQHTGRCPKWPLGYSWSGSTSTLKVSGLIWNFSREEGSLWAGEPHISHKQTLQPWQLWIPRGSAGGRGLITRCKELAWTVGRPLSPGYFPLCELPLLVGGFYFLCVSWRIRPFSGKREHIPCFPWSLLWPHEAGHSRWGPRVPEASWRGGG